MPTSYGFVTYTGNGSTTAYSISFSYIDSTHIKAYLNGVATTAFSIAGSTLTFDTAPTNGVTIRIERETPLTSRLVDFQDGSVLTEADLDMSANQNFYAVQEMSDDQSNNMQLDTDDKYNANSKVIKSVANPVNDNDAVNKTYLENTWLSSANKTALTTVNANIANINAVNSNSTNINSAVSNATNINTVATNIGSVNTVATDIAKVITVANDLAEAVSEVETVADDLNEASSEIDTVAGSITNVDLVGGSIANVNTVATNISAVNTVNTNITAVQNASTNATASANSATASANSATQSANSATASANSATASANSATQAQNAVNSATVTTGLVIAMSIAL